MTSCRQSLIRIVWKCQGNIKEIFVIWFWYGCISKRNNITNNKKNIIKNIIPVIWNKTLLLFRITGIMYLGDDSEVMVWQRL